MTPIQSVQIEMTSSSGACVNDSFSFTLTTSEGSKHPTIRFSFYKPVWEVVARTEAMREAHQRLSAVVEEIGRELQQMEPRPCVTPLTPPPSPVS